MTLEEKLAALQAAGWSVLVCDDLPFPSVQKQVDGCMWLVSPLNLLVALQDVHRLIATGRGINEGAITIQEAGDALVSCWPDGSSEDGGNSDS